MNLFDVYPLFDVSPAKAEGSYITDQSGQQYLDMYGGHAVISIGHSHPHYIKRLTDQLNKIGFYSNSVKIPIQEALATKLGKISGYPNHALFLCNSGAEANENAIKLASFHTGRKKIISFKGSFHGRTSAAVAATDDKFLSAPVNSSDNFIFCEWNNVVMLGELLKAGDVAAVIIEGIQGVAGVNVPGDGFLRIAFSLCEQFGSLLICDEIQSGCGRSGRFFAHQFSGISAHLVTIAKGMGNGFPVAAVLIDSKIKSKHGLLGTTFGGSHLACVASLAVLEVIEKDNLIERAAETGNWLMKELSQIKGVKEIRGRGLMIGIELEAPLSLVRKKLLFDKYIFTGASSQCNTLRILPSLAITQVECQQFITAFKEVNKELMDVGSLALAK